jgi:hypothetical protein
MSLATHCGITSPLLLMISKACLSAGSCRLTVAEYTVYRHTVLLREVFRSLAAALAIHKRSDSASSRLLPRGRNGRANSDGQIVLKCWVQVTPMQPNRTDERVPARNPNAGRTRWQREHGRAGQQRLGRKCTKGEEPEAPRLSICWAAAMSSVRGSRRCSQPTSSSSTREEGG